MRQDKYEMKKKNIVGKESVECGAKEIEIKFSLDMMKV